MNKKVRLPLLATTLVLVAGVLALHAAASPPNHANRFEATFSESTASVTNRIADLGVFQLINTGEGTVEGFGAAKMMLATSQDRTVHPCGAGSWTNAGFRRIVVEAGVLIMRGTGDVCQTPSGPVVPNERWTVDGSSSTGVFAGARGRGNGTVDITNRKSTLSGWLKLAQESD
jgi:hypothetical protein